MLQAPDIRKVVAACDKNALYFGKIVAPQYFVQDSPSFHHVMLNDINDSGGYYKTIVIEVPRGYAKTMIVSTVNPLHRAVFTGNHRRPYKYIVIASYSNDKAKQILADYRNIVNGDGFQWLFPNTTLPKDTENILEIKNADFGFHFMVMARGRGSQVAGIRFLENRPDIFIGDDLEDPEESYNQKIVDDNVRWLDEVVDYALDPHVGKKILIGTPFFFDCTTQRFMKKARGVKVVRFPGLVDNEEMAAQLGIPIGNSIWETRFPTKDVVRRRDDAIANLATDPSELESFLRQIMLDPKPPGTVSIPLEKVHYFDPDKLDVGKLNIFILVDYAYSRKIWADESAIVVIGMDDEANYYVLNAVKGKWGDLGTTSKLLEFVRLYQKNLKAVGVETHSLGFVENSILQAKREGNLNFGTIELKPENKSKAERIKGTISLFEDGRMYFAKGRTGQLESELKNFRGEEMQHGDDLMDAFAYAPKITFKPITEKTKAEKDKEDRHKEWVRFSEDIDRSRRVSRTVRSVNEDRYW
jgi:predicted phage terminase large subunit-like protein